MHSTDSGGWRNKWIMMLGADKCDAEKIKREQSKQKKASLNKHHCSKDMKEVGVIIWISWNVIPGRG